jgi:hypothetical protein
VPSRRRSSGCTSADRRRSTQSGGDGASADGAPRHSFRQERPTGTSGQLRRFPNDLQTCSPDTDVPILFGWNLLKVGISATCCPRRRSASWRRCRAKTTTERARERGTEMVFGNPHLTAELARERALDIQASAAGRHRAPRHPGRPVSSPRRWLGNQFLRWGEVLLRTSATPVPGPMPACTS